MSFIMAFRRSKRMLRDDRFLIPTQKMSRHQQQLDQFKVHPKSDKIHSKVANPRSVRLKQCQRMMAILCIFTVIIYLKMTYRFNFNPAAALTLSFSEWHRDHLLTALNGGSICSELKSSKSKCPKVLIGIGAMKSGSTYFLDALSLSDRGLNLSEIKQLDDQSVFSSLRNRDRYRSLHRMDGDDDNKWNKMAFLQPMNGVNDGVIGNVGELKYWSWCWSTRYRRILTLPLINKLPFDFEAKLLLEKECSFRDYIKKWDLNDVNVSEVVLIEKSANYIREPHTAKLIGFYSEIAPIKVYVSLRDPVDRLWSHYFYRCFNRKHFMNFHCDRDRMVLQIENDLNELKRRYPNWHKMMEIMSGEKGSELMMDAESDLILYFYQKGFYSMNNLIANNDALITSCYYPQLKMWSQSMANGTIKVFEYKHMVSNISNVIYHLRRWVIHDLHHWKQNLHHHGDDINHIPIDRHQLPRRHRTLKYLDKTKNTVKMPPHLRQTLTHFLTPCIQRTAQFLNQNPMLRLVPN